ncbi:hypothetical protein ABLE68_21625 [Nocardioides sp. CN2-186]|uniref:hypothetical protein n=1 Tax=Nocardioides tweenelious TaxID=3156607 RepID=UPI0032B334B8
MTHVIALVVLVPVALIAAIWLGNRMLGQGGPTSSSNALGGFNVFQPTREDAELELESKRHQGVVTPAPDGDDPMKVDIQNNTVRIRRP